MEGLPDTTLRYDRGKLLIPIQNLPQKMREESADGGTRTHTPCGTRS